MPRRFKGQVISRRQSSGHTSLFKSMGFICVTGGFSGGVLSDGLMCFTEVRRGFRGFSEGFSGNFKYFSTGFAGITGSFSVILEYIMCITEGPRGFRGFSAGFR